MTGKLSGFCGVTNPLDSHQRCTKADCPCIHHRMPAPVPALAADGLANDCTHTSATGVDTTPVSDPCKVWRCDHCSLTWTLAQDGERLPAGDPVTAVTRAVADLEVALPDLVKAADDPQALGLALLLADVRDARTKLYGLEQSLEGITAKQLMADQVEGDGVRVERYRARDRKEWDHETWQRDVRAKALRKHRALKAAAVVTADGEPLDVDLYALLADVQAVHGAGAPKVTGLRQLGLDASDYCRTDPGTTHVRVIRLADENKAGETGA